MGIAVGIPSIGFGTGSPRPSTVLPLGGTQDEINAYLQLRLDRAEEIISRKVDGSKIKSAIRISPELVGIEARDIVLDGRVTIRDIIEDQNGTSTGIVHPRITQIVGDKIRTGSIQSNNWGTSEGTAIDLDLSKIWMGGSSAPKLYYDGAGNLEISGTLKAGSIIATSVTVGGVSLGTISSNASTGASHAGSTGNVHSVSLTQISGDLDDISDGSTYFKATSTQLAGGSRAAIGLDGNGKYIKEISTQLIAVSGSNPSNGLVIDTNGLRLYQSSVLKVNLSAAGVAVTGDITGSTGTFAGNITTTGQIFASGSYAYGAYNASIVGASASGSIIGVLGEAVTGIGVHARCTNSSGFALSAENTGGGEAIHVYSGDIAFGSNRMKKTRVNGHLVRIYDPTTHTLLNTYEYQFE